MRTANLSDRLAAALDDRQSGRGLERIAPASNGEVAELEALLRTAAAVAPPPMVEVDPAFRVQARVALIEAIHAESAVTRGPFARFWRSMTGYSRSIAARRSAMPALLVAIVLMLAASGGVAVASQNAQPGDTLFPVKVKIQAAQVALSVPVRQLTLAEETATAVPTATLVPTATSIPTNEARTAAATAVPQAFADLRTDVNRLADDPNVPGKSENGLLAKLRAAEAAFDRGQPRVAEQILGAFDNELDAMRRSGHIDAANFDALKKKELALGTSLSEGGTSTVTGSTADPATTEPTQRPGRGAEIEATRTAEPTRIREGNGPPAERPTPRANPSAGRENAGNAGSNGNGRGRP